MRTATITKQAYRELLRRQERIERQVRTLSEVVRHEADEDRIRPTVLKRWERISRDLDQGKGRVFSSVAAMREWLRKL